MVLRLTTSHVKTRRLYYLYKLAEILEAKGPLQRRILIENIQQWAEENVDHFKRYVDPTGEISTYDAGKRYLNFSKQLHLITSFGYLFENTIFGNILSKLNEGERPYKLSNASRCFLLKRLLYCDFDYLTPITRQLVYEEVDFFSFKKYLQDHLRRVYSGDMSLESTRLLRGIDHWKSPKKFYEENILAPRKAWLIDLGIVDLTENSIEFPDKTKRFLLKIWNLQREELFYFLENEYYKEFAALIRDKTGFVDFSDLTKENRMQSVTNYLEKSFSLFKGGYLKRISSRAFFEFTLCYYLCNEKTICTRRDLEEILLQISASNISPYRYRRVEEISEDGMRVEAGYITADT